VPEEVREERRQRLMELQEDISAELLAAKIGREIEVLVDEVDEEGTIARSAADAPEIDGLVFVNDHFDAEPGDFPARAGGRRRRARPLRRASRACTTMLASPVSSSRVTKTMPLAVPGRCRQVTIPAARSSWRSAAFSKLAGGNEALRSQAARSRLSGWRPRVRPVLA
jgi:hypothetical protein